MSWCRPHAYSAIQRGCLWGLNRNIVQVQLSASIREMIVEQTLSSRSWPVADYRDTLGLAAPQVQRGTRSELRRTVPVLNQWHGHSDVQDVVRRLEINGPPNM